MRHIGLKSVVKNFKTETKDSILHRHQEMNVDSNTIRNKNDSRLHIRIRQEAFNGRPWPASSPVAGVYDIRNSSTKLILINNRRKKDSQLRGKNNPRKEEHRYPEPERHSRSSTPVDRERHSHCLDSSSPYYEPEVGLEMDWLNRSQRPQNRFAAGSAVNPRRHTSCQVPSNPRAFDLRLHSASMNRPNSRTSLPARVGKGPLMAYNELTPGEQRYFASITRIYSNDQMVRLKRRQYIDILNQELAKGLYTKEEYQRYRNYIALGRQRQYLNIRTRTASAPAGRTRSYNQNDTDRSLSSYSGDDKSSESGRQRQNSVEKRPSSDRSSTPVKRPQSVKSNTSRKSTSSGSKTSDEKSSKANTATPKAAYVDKNKETQPQKETDNTEIKDKSEETQPEIKDKSKETQPEKDNENKKEVKEETKSASNEDENVKDQNDLSKKQETETSDSDTNLPPDGQFSAREGHDRPKSRLGHIPGRSANTEDAEEGQEHVEKDDKEDKKSLDEKSISNISIDNSIKKDDATQNIKDDDDVENHKTKKSRDHDDSSSDEEEKDPDKLQY